MDAEPFARLLRAAGAISDREGAALRALRQRAAAIDDEIRALRVVRPGHPMAETGIDPAAAARAAERWHHWRIARLRQLQTQRAGLAAEEETARVAAARALGRVTALERLAARSGPD